MTRPDPTWCDADDCPAATCGGPHVECPGERHPDLAVTLRPGQPCLLCDGPTLATPGRP